jgi:hypothetical protein
MIRLGNATIDLWLPALAVAAAALAYCATAAAEEGAEDPAAAELRGQIDASLEEFSLVTAPEGAPLARRVVLRWDNNARGSEQGVTLLYVAGGRPEAVCCVYPWDGNLVHDFRSMSRGLVEARREGDVVWRPSAAGAEFRPIPEAGPPHASSAARLRQLKTLAGRFGGKLVGWKGDDSDRQELRLLPRPIYRYEEPAGELIDGAVFALVMGVDPEALLVIEGVVAEGERQWEFAFVRRTSGELEGRLDDAVVWTADRYPRTNDPLGLDRSFYRPLAVDAPTETKRTGP